MSRLFDALKRAQGEAADVALDIIERAGTVSLGDAAGHVVPRIADESRRDGVRVIPIQPPAPATVLPFGAGSRAGEQYRIIRTKLVHHPAQPRFFVVTSPGPGDGKTTTAINLAGVLALREGCDVLLLDADLRRPNVARTLGIQGSEGLANVLAGTAFHDVVSRIEPLPNLHVLPAGIARRNPAELLDSGGWRDLCHRVRSEFRFVVVDGPPVETVADYELIQAVSDGVLMVVRPDHTEKASCARALKQVPKEKLLGLVMNHVEDWFFGKRTGYYYYDGEQPSK
ncbi:MAG: CpsD/CapB family tyrosine-protein kinase [Bryobacterales bacterium]|nr:CpsD/CapB family tyrosine-protein kinase [Bryobacterales bacterium]